MGGMDYTEWKNNGATIGGMMDMPGQVPAEVPAHWLVYFAVADTDATVAAAEKLGATMPCRPPTSPRAASPSSADPAGAMFAVIKTNPVT